MEFLVEVLLPVILYVVAIILLIILIILGIRLIKVLNKVDRVMDNVEEKINTFDGALAVLKTASDGVASITDNLVFGVTSAISKIFGKFRGNYKEEEDYEKKIRNW